MKARLNKLISAIFFTPKPLVPGLYHSNLDANGKLFRLHLRIQEEGEGILVINASTILHLNATATEIVYHLIKGTPEVDIAGELIKRYQVTHDEAKRDIDNLRLRLETLMTTPDLDPETFLGMESNLRHSSLTKIPLRLDCALTYQGYEGRPDLYAPVKKVTRLLDTEEWGMILTKAWEAGIPHVVFTGGEPTLRPDLIELIRKAEEIGQVTGLITDGLRLTEKEYLHEILQSGLDHIMVILEPKNDQSYEAIKDVITEDIYVTVHLTISKANVEQVPQILKKLQKLDVRHLSLSATSTELNEALLEVNREAITLGSPFGR